MINIFNLKNIDSDTRHSFLNEILQLYISSFPENERRPWSSTDDIEVFTKAKSEKFHIIAITLDDAFAGFMTYWDFCTHIYIEHLSIMPKLRSQRLGSSLIDHAIKNISDKIILEVEHPDTPEACRRIEFYQRHGFRLLTDIEYMQPPYSPHHSPTPLLLMTHGQLDITDENDTITSLKSEVYNHPVTPQI